MAAAAPTPIPALAPALRLALDDPPVLEEVGAEEVESVGEAVDVAVVSVNDELVVYR